MDISFNIACTLMKFYVPIFKYVMEGTLSHVFYLGPIEGHFYFQMSPL